MIKQKSLNIPQVIFDLFGIRDFVVVFIELAYYEYKGLSIPSQYTKMYILDMVFQSVFVYYLQICFIICTF
ncbi:MAG: hypothetical protein K0R50_639 [Eubacterium sp.]|nr:hypothetical protein [Eubacterium sp.]